MNKQLWKEQILAALSRMADEEFQRRAWTGVGPEVSSQVEVICGLFDDALLREYVERYAGTMSPSTAASVSKLNDIIQNIELDRLDKLPAAQIISSPQWVKIRGLARDLKVIFEQD